MAITQPDVLVVMDATSGKSTTNYGAAGGTYNVRSDAGAVEGDDFAWNASGPFAGGTNGYLNCAYAGNGSNVAVAGNPVINRLTSSLGSIGNGLPSMNVMVAFYPTSVLNGSGRIVSPPADSVDNGFGLEVNTFSGGTCSLDAWFNAQGAQVSMTTVTGLTVDTWHILSASCDTSTASAVQARFKVNSAAVDSPATVSMATFTFNGGWPILDGRADHANYYGFVGRLGPFIFQRGTSIAWNATDLGTINSNPVSAFSTWWPGASAGGLRNPTIGPFGAPFLGKL